MGEEFRLSFDVTPVPKGRPRFTRRGHTYTPKETLDYERRLQWLAKEAWKRPPLEGALYLSVVVGLVRGPSVRREYPTTRPDLDNYVKAVMDALNGITWSDDAQIVSLAARKVYMPQAQVSISFGSLDHTTPAHPSPE